MTNIRHSRSCLRRTIRGTRIGTAICLQNFTYWCNGDVALSVTMSFMSTIAAFGLMPFWIWVL